MEISHRHCRSDSYQSDSYFHLRKIISNPFYEVYSQLYIFLKLFKHIKIYGQESKLLVKKHLLMIHKALRFHLINYQPNIFLFSKCRTFCRYESTSTYRFYFAMQNHLNILLYSQSCSIHKSCINHIRSYHLSILLNFFEHIY